MVVTQITGMVVTVVMSIACILKIIKKMDISSLYIIYLLMGFAMTIIGSVLK
jgi:multidrug transporter EmrE-like cation transporter